MCDGVDYTMRRYFGLVYGHMGRYGRAGLFWIFRRLIILGRLALTARARVLPNEMIGSSAQAGDLDKNSERHFGV